MRGLGLLALPAGLLASASPQDRLPAPPPRVVLAALGPDASMLVKTQLQATVKQGDDVKHARSSVAEVARAPRRSPSEGRRAVHAISDALSKCRSELGEKQRWNIARAIEREARRHGYDPLFVQALVEVESTCKPTAKSSRGAMGLTQVRPSTARAIALEAGMPWRGASTLLEPGLNLRLGLLYLTQLYDRFGDMNLAMAAYNLGPDRAASMSRDRARRSDYVRKILGRYEDLRANHATALS